MKGWQIFVHSVRLVFSNLDAALRISLLLYVIYAAAQFWLLTIMPTQPMGAGSAEMAQMMSPAVALASLGSVLVTMAVSIWIAVAWHRYVLLEEVPRGWVPAFHGGLMLGYLGRSILLGIIVIAIAVVMGSIFGVVAAGLGLPGIAVAGGVLSLAAGIFVFYRLCPILPAGASAQPISLGRAWSATQATGGAVIVLVILTLLASFILGIPNYVSGDPNSTLSIIYSLVVGWIMMLVGISVLTTFYGHYVEGREID